MAYRVVSGLGSLVSPPRGGHGGGGGCSLAPATHPPLESEHKTSTRRALIKQLTAERLFETLSKDFISVILTPAQEEHFILHLLLLSIHTHAPIPHATCAPAGGL